MSDEKFTLDDIVRIQTNEIERVKTLADDGPHGLAIRAGVHKALFDDFMTDLAESPDSKRDAEILMKLYIGAHASTEMALNGKPKPPAA